MSSRPGKTILSRASISSAAVISITAPIADIRPSVTPTSAIVSKFNEGSITRPFLMIESKDCENSRRDLRQNEAAAADLIKFLRFIFPLPYVCKQQEYINHAKWHKTIIKPEHLTH
jgi:hypothetical protein